MWSWYVKKAPLLTVYFELSYHVDHNTTTSDQTLTIHNLSLGYCDIPVVCIHGNTTQLTYNDCYRAWSLPAGNCYDANELFINITEMLNGSANASLLYTVVCLRSECGFPVVQVVTHNLRLIVPNELPNGTYVRKLYTQQSCNFYVHVIWIFLYRWTKCGINNWTNSRISRRR